MQIDWFTLIAQIINFLLLVLLLKHFLYDRIIQVMDDREQRIRSRLDEAEQKRKSAEEEAQKYRKKTKELEQQRREKLEQAEQEAESKRKELMKQAREEIDRQKSQWKHTLEREQEDFLRDLKYATGEQVYAVTRRVVQDLAHEDLEGQIVRIFLERLQSINDDEKERLRSIIQQSQETVEIRSAFEISEELRQNVKTTLEELADNHTPDMQFTQSEEMLGGIELSANGQKIGWSIRGYLTDMEQKWHENLGEIVTQEEETT